MAKFFIVFDSIGSVAWSIKQVASMLKVPDTILVSDNLFPKLYFMQLCSAGTTEKLALLFQVVSVVQCKLLVVKTQEV